MLRQSQPILRATRQELSRHDSLRPAPSPAAVGRKRHVRRLGDSQPPLRSNRTRARLGTRLHSRIYVYTIKNGYQLPLSQEREESARAGHLVRIGAGFEWNSALLVEDLRKDYGERRFQALGLIGNRLHVMVFTPRANKAHVISLRKANKREVKRYEAQA